MAVHKIVKGSLEAGSLRDPNEDPPSSVEEEGPKKGKHLVSGVITPGGNLNLSTWVQGVYERYQTRDEFGKKPILEISYHDKYGDSVSVLEMPPRVGYVSYNVWESLEK